MASSASDSGRRAACPVCGHEPVARALSGTDRLIRAAAGSFTLDGCPACGCLFVFPRPSPGEIAGFYPSGYWWNPEDSGLLHAFESLYRNLVLRDHVAFITDTARRLGKPAGEISILDIGCGSGTLLSLLAGKGYRVTGLDTSRVAGEIARRSYGIDVKTGTVEENALEAESFDIVSLFHIMEHVLDPSLALARAIRLLRPGGYLVIQVPNVESIQCALLGARWVGIDIPRHVTNYTPGAMARLLAAAGLEPVRVSFFCLRDNAPAVISSVLPGLDPLHRGSRSNMRAKGLRLIASWAAHLTYFLLVSLVTPLTTMESALGRGATFMMASRKGA